MCLLVFQEYCNVYSYILLQETFFIYFIIPDAFSTDLPYELLEMIANRIKDTQGYLSFRHSCRKCHLSTRFLKKISFNWRDS